MTAKEAHERGDRLRPLKGRGSVILVEVINIEITDPYILGDFYFHKVEVPLPDPEEYTYKNLGM